MRSGAASGMVYQELRRPLPLNLEPVGGEHLRGATFPTQAAGVSSGLGRGMNRGGQEAHWNEGSGSGSTSIRRWGPLARRANQAARSRLPRVILERRSEASSWTSPPRPLSHRPETRRLFEFHGELEASGQRTLHLPISHFFSDDVSSRVTDRHQRPSRNSRRVATLGKTREENDQAPKMVDAD